MKTIKMVCAAALPLITSGAMAATSWTVADFMDGANGATAQAVAITAWSTTGASGALAAATPCDYTPNGWGIVNSSEGTCATAGTGPHAADNVTHTDMFLLQFNAPVSLSQLTIGWNGTDNATGSYVDSDISVLAYLGAGSGSSIVNNKTLSGLLGPAAWTVVGNYANVGANAGETASISTTTTSSWWLISAYSSTFGTGTNLGDGNDAFKLISVAVTSGSKVPEPAALLLVGTGLMGMLGLRRRERGSAV